MTRTAVFDFDGTLADTARLTMAALGRVCPALGLEPITEARVKAAIGYSGHEFYDLLCADMRPGARGPFELMLEETEAGLREELAPGLIFSGCREMLRELAEAGVGLHIASTGGAGHVLTLLNLTGLRPFFATVQCGAPEKGRMLEKLRKSEPGPLAMVGDMRKDWQAARQNKIPSIGARYGYCVPAPGTFDYYANTPGDVVSLLRGGMGG